MRPFTAAVLLCLPGFLPFSISAQPDSAEPSSVVVYEHFASGSVSMGYKNNILYSSIATANDWFSTLSADSGLMRMSDSGSFLLLYLLAEETRYSNTPEVHFEQLFSGQAEYAVPAGDDVEVGIQANYSYLRSIIDASQTEADVYRILVKSHELSVSSYRQKMLSEHWTTQLEIEGRRQIYIETLDPFSEASAKASISYNYGNRSDVSIDWQSTARLYDTRTQTHTDGAYRNGTTLRYAQHEIRSQWRHYWDEQQNLRTTTRLSALLNCDNGSGYYDYRRMMFRQQIQWKTDDWRIKADGGGTTYRYRMQQIENNRLTRSFLFVSTRIEKKLTPQWKIHLETRHEWNIGNDPLDEYTGWTASVGALFDF